MHDGLVVRLLYNAWRLELWGMLYSLWSWVGAGVGAGA